ncbi:dTDP-4-dehydrorhamnose 3,5-epimerase family protein [Corynebacterium halotolerans]|uniref:dTDP-4-dehydrorhamnose reductase n=1 Tax=Corynebacterium halotolerans YIM 70093 = DSM 44683 TaxID=1121362 RepID=M1MUN1_9CORY|nr:dTDP-4-dehydrorhamnose 3,5-epimerase [Corynebacterium halotolerans]AGF71449.1 dTDP-4-dehydrorhamnose reductase [Corynebacterium halotolerans YIM 70093 = DSM 44683]
MLHELDELPGVFRSEPTIHPDERGTFHEWFKASEFEAATGHPFDLQQANMSTSRAGVLRGLHFADVPPGQAKFVACVAGRILDVVVDVRVGSETFGRHVALELSADNRHGVYLPVGFAHAFLALEDSTVAYLTTSEYAPGVEHGVSPFSAGIDWPEMDFLLSDKDRDAMTLDDARAAGVLPDVDECRAHENELRDGWVLANEQAGQW